MGIGRVVMVVLKNTASLPAFVLRHFRHPGTKEAGQGLGFMVHDRRHLAHYGGSAPT